MSHGSHPSFPKAPAPKVGTDQADAEHGIQMGLIKAAREALGEGRTEAGELMGQLYDYTEMHFMSESLLMRMSSRPDYEAHLAEHERLLADLAAARALLERGHASQAAQQLTEHERQVIDHICSWDRSL